MHEAGRLASLPEFAGRSRVHGPTWRLASLIHESDDLSRVTERSPLLVSSRDLPKAGR